MNEQLPSLERLGREFERVAHARPKRSWLRRRAGLLVSLGVVSGSTVALAASGMLDGAPVKDPAGTPKAQPHVAGGVVRAGAATLTSLRVADPDGGPSWGLRTLATTRQLGCVQVGRVVGGRLGVLGQDGAFGNDGRFHELRPDVQVGRDCVLLDAAGKLYIAMSVQGIPASAQSGSCVIQRPSAAVLRRMRKVSKKAADRQQAMPSCPRRDVRILYYGTLGPEAKSVTYRDRGRLKTAPTSGPAGAYLVVVRPDRGAPARGYYVPSASPGSGLVAVTYRDGHRCVIPNPRAIGGAKPCPRVGYAASVAAPLPTTPLRANVTARISRTRVTVPGPAAAKQWAIRISFVAPAAAGPRSRYLVTRAVPGRNCRRSQSVAITTVDRDIRAGERVSATLYAPQICNHAVHGTVRFQRNVSMPVPGMFTPSSPRQAPLVGRYAARVPRP